MNSVRHVSVRVIAPIAFGMGLLIIWQSACAAGQIPASILPAPLAVGHRLGRELASGQLLPAAGTTCLEALLGCLLAAVVALPLAYAISRWHLVDATVSPYVAASQAIPAIAIAQLLVVWIGYGLAPIALLCALVVFFPMLLTTTLGLRGIDKTLLEAAQLDGAGSWALLRYLQAPLARRAILTGLRNGFTLSITGAVVGEWVMGGTGLGMIVQVQASANDTTGLFTTIAVLCVLAIAVYTLLLAIEHCTDPLRS